MKTKAIISSLIIISAVCMANAQNKKDNLAQQAAMCAKLPMSADGIIRLSKVEVDPEYLDEYMTFAAKVGETSLLTEPGVLTMYALQEKNNPCNITIPETYAPPETLPHATIHCIMHLYFTQ